MNEILDQTTKRFSGVHAVLYALFDRSGQLDRGAMRSQVEALTGFGVDGITILGLATEVQKLSVVEQRDLVVWIAGDVAGRSPFSVTVSGNNVKAQRDMVEFALGNGADWLILQPPAQGLEPGQTDLDFFLRVADGFDATFAIQNAPAFLGRSLSNPEIDQLVASNPNFSLIKAEIPAVELAELVRGGGRNLTVLNGRGGLELTDCLRAGAAGFVLAPDVIDHSKAAFDAWSRANENEAEAIYQTVLPAMTFMMQSVEFLVCYGKRVYGARTNTPIHDRSPAMAPTEFGLTIVERWAEALGPFGARHAFGKDADT